jgi:hypothetical protein
MDHGKIAAGPGKPPGEMVTVFTRKKIKIILDLTIYRYRKVICNLIIRIYDGWYALLPFAEKLEVLQFLFFCLLRFRLYIALQPFFLFYYNLYNLCRRRIAGQPPDKIPVFFNSNNLRRTVLPVKITCIDRGAGS